MEIPDKIGKLSLDKFNSLPKTGKPKPNEWTVLSCIVLEDDSKLEVVSLGTGLKCIGINKMSKNGDILNDSHAEIVCRRGFLRYLYEQIENCSNGKQSIFLQKAKFELKTAKFHFFTTLMPCGDASIFPKNQNHEECDIVDIFRTGAKCLKKSLKQDPRKAGEEYHVTGVVRTKPGRGDPTVSVSCSDKLAKWCCLGIQGALLSLLTEPIYLSSLIIANNTPYCEESFRRALFTRVEGVEIKRPEIGIFQCKIDFEYQKNELKQPCPSSIIWYQSEVLKKSLEIAVDGKKQGVTKKNEHFDKARLKICKLELFKLFLRCDSKGEFCHLNYAECKKKSKIYQENWRILREKFGAWPEKQGNLLEFYDDNAIIPPCKKKKHNP